MADVYTSSWCPLGIPQGIAEYTGPGTFTDLGISTDVGFSIQTKLVKLNLCKVYF